jgi:hypothetical protein
MNAHNFFDIRALTYAVGRAVLGAVEPQPKRSAPILGAAVSNGRNVS